MNMSRGIILIREHWIYCSYLRIVYHLGLSPATSNTVKIQAKNLTGKFENNVKPDKLAAILDFKTLSGGRIELTVNCSCHR